MSAKDTMTILLAQKGYFGEEADKLIHNWYSNDYKAVYPSDPWEAANEYFQYHDLDSYIKSVQVPEEAFNALNRVFESNNTGANLIDAYVRSWDCRIDPSIRIAYPENNYEAVDLYLQTHDWSDFLDILGIVQDDVSDLALPINEFYGIPYDQFERVTVEWYSTLSDEEKKGLPSDIFEAADLWAKNYSFHELCLRADIRDNIKAYLRLHKIFTDHGIPESEHKQKIIQILNETPDDERYRYSIDLYEAALSNVDKYYGEPVVEPEIERWLEQAMDSIRKTAPGYISDSYFNILGERIEKAIKYPLD